MSKQTNKPISKQTLALYWTQVKRFRASFFVMLVLVPTASVIITSALPYCFSQTVGHMTNHDETGALNWFWLSIATGILAFIVNLIGFRAMMIHESKMVTQLRNKTFQSLLNKDMLFFVNEKIGAMTSKYIDYVRAETTLQDLLIIRSIGFAISMIVGIAIVASTSFVLGGLLVFLITALIIQMQWSLRKRQYWRTIRKDTRSEIHGHVADSLTNQLIVKTFNGEKRELHRLEKLGETFTMAFRKDIGFFMVEGSFRVLLSIMVQLAVLGYSLYLLHLGQLSVATIIFSMGFLQLIGQNLFSLAELLNGYQEALLEAQPMTEMLLKATQVNDNPASRDIHDANPSVEFKNVSYAYEDCADPVLRDVCIKIPAGQKVGLVGHSGAGKTTISHLLLRFADVSEGSISIGGHDLRDFTQESLRSHIAFVPQEPMLFHRSLRENIAYGRPDASQDEIVVASKQANAWEFIEDLPNGLDTLVGERGVKLSGGQRQRIAIARAILKDAPILLLDEATSALDSESEKLIQDSLHGLMKGRTSIVIAHRLSTIAKLDRIIVLNHGKITEDGTHSELLAKGGTYARLWSHQSGGFIEE